MTTLLRRLRSMRKANWTLTGGLLLMLVLAFAGSAYGVVTSSTRVDPAVRQAAASEALVNVVIDLGFKPGSFHMRQLQARGIIGLVTDTTVQLRRVNRANLEELSKTPWITRVIPLQ